MEDGLRPDPLILEARIGEKMRINHKVSLKRFGRILPIVFIVSCAAVALASSAAKDWYFTNEDQMKAAIEDSADNPRATYYVILRAHGKKLSGQAAISYYGLLQKKPNDPYLQSAFAFSHFMATGIVSSEFGTQRASNLTQQLRKQHLEADFYRDKSIASKPDSPTILVEAAQFLLHENNQRPRAVGYLRKAAKLSPKWEQAHFWLGRGLNMLGVGKPREVSAPLGKEALAAYARAEQLKPYLRTDCLIGYAYCHQAMGQHEKELEFLNAYLRARPEEGKNVTLAKWRESLMKKARIRSSRNGL